LSFTANVTDQLGNSVDFPINLVVENVNEAPDAIVLDSATVRKMTRARSSGR
jgi:hypothetical protein